MLVDPVCPICGGTGVLGLGAGALNQYAPDVVSKALENGLQSAARSWLWQTGNWSALDLGPGRRRLANAVTTMRRAGLLARLPADQQPAPVVGVWVADDRPQAAGPFTGTFAAARMLCAARPQLPQREAIGDELVPMPLTQLDSAVLKLRLAGAVSRANTRLAATIAQVALTNPAPGDPAGGAGYQPAAASAYQPPRSILTRSVSNFAAAGLPDPASSPAPGARVSASDDVGDVLDQFGIRRR